MLCVKVVISAKLGCPKSQINKMIFKNVVGNMVTTVHNTVFIWQDRRLSQVPPRP